MDDDLYNSLCQKFSFFLPWHNGHNVNFNEIVTSSINRLWSVNDGRLAWVIKCCRNDFSLKWLSDANCILSVLQQNSIDTTLVNNGNEYFIPDGGTFWSLSNYQKKRSDVGLNDRVVIEYAINFLKKMHNISVESFCENRKNHIGRCDVSTALSYDGSLYDYVCSPALLSSTLKVNVGTIFCAACKEIDLRTLKEKFFSLRHVISHGEFQNQNAYLSMNNSVVVIDWDNVYFRPRIIDVITLIAFFCRMKRGGFILDADNVRFVMNSFALSEIELDIIADIAFLYLLPSSYMIDKFTYYKAASLDWYVPWAIAAALQVREQLKWMVGHYEK